MEIAPSRSPECSAATLPPMSALPEPNLDDAEDRALVAAIRRGDSSAWGLLAKRYQHRLYSICVRMVNNREWANDLTQEAFVKVIQGFETFDDKARLSTWMIRVTMNTCLSALRAQRVRKTARLEAVHDARAPGTVPRDSDWEPSGRSRVEHSEERQRLLAALDSIDPEQRAILVLRDGRDLDYDQIAVTLNIPVGTVKSRLFRARAALREKVEELGRFPAETDEGTDTRERGSGPGSR